jgi:hypothetical protein
MLCFDMLVEMHDLFGVEVMSEKYQVFVQTTLDTELSINSIMCFDSIQSTGARASK